MWGIIKNSPEWRATQKQSARIQAVLEKLAELDMMLKQIEPVDQNRNYNLRWNLNTIGNRAEFCATHTRWLQSHFGDEFLDTVLPEFLAFPDENPFKPVSKALKMIAVWPVWHTALLPNGWWSAAVITGSH